ncbi:MAG: hypothetical protein NT069_07875, partial [Planctomycetota bacterium]|nr:hypothetical protein [Planctomycetota bacterium]
YATLQDTFVTLARNGHLARLFELYDDNDVWVQIWAASHTLEIDEERALEKLKQLENSRVPLIATIAKHTAVEWKSGRLRFPHPPG